MDPTTCMVEILKALEGPEVNPENRERAIERLRNLADWLERGGFVPNMVEVLEQMA